MSTIAMDNDAFDAERFLSRKAAQNMGFQRAKPFGGWVAREGGAFPGPLAVPVPSPPRCPICQHFLPFSPIDRTSPPYYNEIKRSWGARQGLVFTHIFLNGARVRWQDVKPPLRAARGRQSAMVEHRPALT